MHFFSDKTRNFKVLFGFCLILLIFVLVILVLSVYIGYSLINPDRTPVEETPPDALSYREVTFQSREDNLALEGWLFTPNLQKDHDADKETTIIMAHGYGQNRLQGSNALELTEFLLEKGFSVFLFDFRNSGNSEEAITSVGQFEQDDLLGAVDFVKSEIESSKIVLHGFSMGASTAILVGAEENAVDGVIADSPFAHLPDYLSENLPQRSGLPVFPFNWTILNTIPIIADLDLQAVSPKKSVQTYQIPLLLIHGKADETIPAEDSYTIKHQGPNSLVELEVFPDAGHVNSFSSHPDAYREVLFNFLTDLNNDECH